MDSYSAEVFAEAHRQRIIDEAERRQLLRSGSPDPEPGQRRSWIIRRPFAIVRRLGHATEAS